MDYLVEIHKAGLPVISQSQPENILVVLDNANVEYPSRAMK